jgi:hypothetical protein
VSDAGKELFDLGYERIDGSEPRIMVDAFQLDPTCSRDVVREVLADLDGEDVTFGVEDEGRHLDRREDTPHIDFVDELPQRSQAAGACREAFHLGP